MYKTCRLTLWIAIQSDEAESNGLHEEGGFATATHRLWPCFPVELEEPKMAEMNLDDFGQEPQLALFPEKRWRWGLSALFLDAPRESSPLR